MCSHGGVQTALAVRRCAGDGWKPGWRVLTCQTLPPFPLAGPGEGRQSKGLLTNKATQNPVTLLNEPGWIGRASGVGLSAEKGWTWENRLSSSEISPQSPWDSSSACWRFGSSVRPRCLDKGQDTATESLCEAEASLLSSRVNSGADEDSASLAMGESWSWDQALKFQAST